jgi:oligopeptide/dipeptide ABC transporter ATP-binding protein
MTAEGAEVPESLLVVEELKKHFPIRSGLLSRLKGFIRALDGVTFELEHGKTLGIVGESGSGKSTLARTIVRLIDPTSGSVVLIGQPLTELRGKKLRKARVNFQMVFQDPISSLNPRKLAIDIIGEPLKVQFKLHGEELTREVADLMAKVGLEKPQLYRYPHEFSGGQKQRLGIARAVALHPKLLILDEPTSNLDVSVQAQILRLLAALQKEFDLTYLFISHDMAVVYHMCDLVMVMYAGKVVERAETRSLYTNPLHPYTRALLEIAEAEGKDLTVTLAGEPPSLRSLPPGCRFHPRCPYKVDVCDKLEPELLEVEPGHFVACHVFGVAPAPPATEVHDDSP